MAKTTPRSRTKAAPADVTAPAAPARPLRGAQQQATRGHTTHVRHTTRTAPPPPVDDDEFQHFPVTLYRKTAVSAKFPNGYEARQFADEAEVEAAGKGWKDSPEGMTPEVPHGHEE